MTDSLFRMEIGAVSYRSSGLRNTGFVSAQRVSSTRRRRFGFHRRNGLTDLVYPCQVLAGVLTIRQHLGGYEGKRVAWIGDGNNMANSWLNAAYTLGFDLTLACPEGYDPDAKILARAKKMKAKVRVVRDPAEAADKADVINTDVWASMGQEEEQAIREKSFRTFIVDEKLMKRASKDAIFLHCLPAHVPRFRLFPLTPEQPLP